MGEAILTVRSGLTGGSSGGEQVGDIKISTRTDLGDKYLLCNGSSISLEDYPKLDMLEKMYINGYLEKALLEEFDNSGNSNIYYINGYWILQVDSDNLYYSTDILGPWKNDNIPSNIYTSQGIYYCNNYYILLGANVNGNMPLYYSLSMEGPWNTINISTYESNSYLNSIVYDGIYYRLKVSPASNYSSSTIYCSTDISNIASSNKYYYSGRGKLKCCNNWSYHVSSDGLNGTIYYTDSSTITENATRLTGTSISFYDTVNNRIIVYTYSNSSSDAYGYLYYGDNPTNLSVIQNPFGNGVLIYDIKYSESLNLYFAKCYVYDSINGSRYKLYYSHNLSEWVCNNNAFINATNNTSTSHINNIAIDNNNNILLTVQNFSDFEILYGKLDNLSLPIIDTSNSYAYIRAKD